MTVQELPDSHLVKGVCMLCGIKEEPGALSDDQIARVCKWLGENEPGTQVIDGQLAISRTGWDMMIFVAICDFPEFFVRHQLAMVWRN